jgi:hypothetical protein
VKTVPLHGKKAAGRVALVDDEDYDLVMQYRWHVLERAATATKSYVGPYATTNWKEKGKIRHALMHCLIMGAKGIDHADHYGLNNQRSNLRIATGSQNNQNMRPRRGAKSPYKGVSWNSRNRRWLVHIKADGRIRYLGSFFSDLEAAYVYDAAARELFGEFACPNFPEGPTQAMRDEWRVAAAGVQRHEYHANRPAWWAQREPETRICTVCGGEYQTKAHFPTLYCGDKCKGKAYYYRVKERELEGRLF